MAWATLVPQHDIQQGKAPTRVVHEQQVAGTYHSVSCLVE
jgi:hypothetical protein